MGTSAHGSRSLTIWAVAVSLAALSPPAWAVAQRWVLGSVFAGIALKLALDERR